MDPTAIELVQQILTRHAASLELYARQWSSTPEDIVQEAILKLAQEHPRPQQPVAWLYRTVRNRAISAARSEQRRRRHEASATPRQQWFTSSLDDVLDAEEVTRALVDLPLDQREIVIARLWGGLSFEEIATLADCSASAAHRRYVAALSTLRERFGASCPPTNE
jgi:RNA polymerase sigma-70 factor (ECF subfamily)